MKKIMIIAALCVLAFPLFSQSPLDGEWYMAKKYVLVSGGTSHIQFQPISFIVFSGDTADIYYCTMDGTYNKNRKVVLKIEQTSIGSSNFIALDVEYEIIKVNDDFYLLLAKDEGGRGILYELGSAYHLIRGPMLPKAFGLY